MHTTANKYEPATRLKLASKQMTKRAGIYPSIWVNETEEPNKQHSEHGYQEFFCS